MPEGSFLGDGETKELRSLGVDAGASENGEWTWGDRPMVNHVVKHSTHGRGAASFSMASKAMRMNETISGVLKEGILRPETWGT